MFDKAYVCFENSNGEMVYKNLDNISKDSIVYVKVTDANDEISIEPFDAE